MRTHKTLDPDSEQTDVYVTPCMHCRGPSGSAVHTAQSCTALAQLYDSCQGKPVCSNPALVQFLLRFFKSAHFNKMPPVSSSFEVSRDPPDIESLLALNPRTKVFALYFFLSVLHFLLNMFYVSKCYVHS